MSFTTLTILDGGGTSRTLRVWDESGAGTGPYSFGQTLVNGTTALTDTTGIKISTSQLAALLTTAQPMSANYQLVGLPSDQDWTSMKTASRAAAGDYETVSASATDQAMGATGAAGDYLRELLIIPGTTSPGAVSIKDGSGSAITVFAGGATSVSNLVPFSVPVGAISLSGAWKITTGTNVTAIGFGKFT